MSSSPFEFLLFVVLPYAAVVLFAAGMVWRFRSAGTISSRSSQILEKRALLWGTIPFHIGIFALVAGHLLPVVIPRYWQRLLSNSSALMAIEAIGLGAAIVGVAGLAILLMRRLLSSSLRTHSTVGDFLVVAVLLGQMILGLIVAAGFRWGALWSVATTTPYLWSLVTLRPDPSFVTGLPVVMTLHLTGAWILLAALPFTRLIHGATLPIGYLFRRPQKVIWASR